MKRLLSRQQCLAVFYGAVVIACLAALGITAYGAWFQGQIGHATSSVAGGRR